MTSKTHSPERLRELAAEGFAIVAQRQHEMRERERPKRSAPASPAHIAKPVHGNVSDPAALAQQIVRAGQRARGEHVEEPP
jgi:hypothetical protein